MSAFSWQEGYRFRPTVTFSNHNNNRQNWQFSRIFISPYSLLHLYRFPRRWQRRNSYGLGPCWAGGPRPKGGPATLMHRKKVPLWIGRARFYWERKTHARLNKTIYIFFTSRIRNTDIMIMASSKSPCFCSDWFRNDFYADMYLL